MKHVSKQQVAGSVAAIAILAAPMASFAAGAGMSAQKFVTKAGQINMLEIKLGQLAQNKSDNSQVDAFAKQMVSDHSSLQDKLSSTAKAQKLKMPDELPPKLQKKYQHLSQLSGERFNKAYARFNVKGHTEAVALFKKEKANDNNAAVSAVAGDGLPVIQHHLSMAKQMKQAVAPQS